jgi:hypothetical protein
LDVLDALHLKVDLIELLEVHRGKHEAHGKQASKKEHVCYISWSTVIYRSVDEWMMD